MKRGPHARSGTPVVVEADLSMAGERERCNSQTERTRSELNCREISFTSVTRGAALSNAGIGEKTKKDYFVARNRATCSGTPFGDVSQGTLLLANLNINMTSYQHFADCFKRASSFAEHSENAAPPCHGGAAA